jgi:enterochelin esterase-like enzyme
MWLAGVWRKRGLVFRTIALLPLLVIASVMGRGDIRADEEGTGVTPLPPGVSRSRAESPRFWSQILGREMPYSVYLPPGYDSNPDARYPVLYMLHGYSELANDEWKIYGIFTKADRLIRTGEVPAFIIVLPAGGYSYWMDHANGGPRWGAYTATEVVAEVDGRYRTIPDGRRRAIGGHSMGGHGALQLAINFPGVFGIVGAHSPSLRDFPIAFEWMGDREYFDAHDPLFLYHAYPALARTLVLWLDVGTEDDWLPLILAFHQQLEADGIPHTFVQYPGIHEQEYWNQNTETYLRFYGAALGGPVPASSSANGGGVTGGAAFVSAPTATEAVCPGPGQWLGLYWRGAAAPVLSALRACPDARRAWVRRETAWLGASPGQPESSDQFDIGPGEFVFLRG